VHPIGKTAAPALDQQHLGISRLGPAQRSDQPLALFGAHGAVVELERQFADVAELLVANGLIDPLVERLAGY